ncbi:glycoside hydrolase family 5 protein [Mixia osmundae IAM 14324]|uniref:mannan endo-1,4-beta-mannosidase n=1 Tax=Mixia osmundae (strain CBS 9802 / IAM 14324 / JCM 22182 / KY 12970) TaxID=764103 RepID=G7DYA6_MIXOS|nr:glycoside hydrolase family 5 protein [Mixia osmundae IAM 14324]KEI41468.1 glycoside hydrolase family 5 protein [Mixia osmundae IAM 14324]GAA95566.1 hypothetical protein E5Q_02221 [Mixia osmundae IAM 14324]
MFNEEGPAKASASVDPTATEMQESARNTPSRPGTSMTERSGEIDPFVIKRNGQLWHESVPYRFASFNAPELLDNDVWEVKDTMRTLSGFSRRVTRTYTLQVKSWRVSRGHINAWSETRQDWEYDEAHFVKIDHVLALARQYQVKLIIPIINQDYGQEGTNWVGNFTDLIRLRTGKSYEEVHASIDWWTDKACIDSFKKIITYLLNRVNTVNGVRYGDDATILAWETGNEMNLGGKAPAPGSWTVTIAQHIKTLAPRSLVMDGSYSRNDDIIKSYPSEVLGSPDVDILSYHYYGAGEAKRIRKDIELAKKHDKIFVAGEFGFFHDPAEFATFTASVKAAGGAGCLVWSLRPHSVQGGFKTHGEGDGIFSYHVPGWAPRADEFDPREAAIVHTIRQASYELNRERVPPHPTPPPPDKVWLIDNGAAMTWLGSAWAASYEIWVAGEHGQQEWTLCQAGHLINVQAGKHSYPIPQHLQRAKEVAFLVRGIGVDGHIGAWSTPCIADPTAA